MQPKYEYRRRLPHYQKDDHPLFVTFTTDHRWELPTAARGIVLNCCLHENMQKYSLHAAVVMPDHVHLIYSPLRREDGWSYSLPEVMKAIKAALHGRLTSRSTVLAQYGRRNSSIMFCARMTALWTGWIMSATILCEQGW